MLGLVINHPVIVLRTAGLREQKWMESKLCVGCHLLGEQLWGTHWPQGSKERKITT